MNWTHFGTALLFVFFPLVASAQPRADHHQHLVSPRSAELSPTLKVITARDLIAELDAVGIRQATVLSVAYMYGNPNRPPVADEYQRVKEENDWTSRQVAEFPNRLRGFCGVNPLKDYAIAEIERCAKDGYLKTGLKLHFGNSDVNLEDPDHVRRLRAVFQAADRHRMAIVVHMRANFNLGRPWGARQATAFLDNVLPEAPHVVVQIAHMAGAGSYDEPTDGALGVFADAFARKDARMRKVYIEMSGVAGIGPWRDRVDTIVARVRQIGTSHLLFGSDVPPKDALMSFHELPLTAAEFTAIERNVAPYF